MAVAAIVGAGVMGRWHADAVRRLGGRVALVVDHEIGRARELAGEGDVATTLDPEAVARSATVAHLCTPVETHEEIAIALVDAGVHLLIEKPLTEHAPGTASLLERASSRGVLVCPVHQFGFQRGVRRLLGTASSLRPIRHVEFEARSAGADGGDDRARDHLVAEILPHPFGLLAELLPVPPDQLDWQVARPQPGELRALAVCRGVTIDLLVSTHGRPTTNFLRVVGDRGTAVADLYHGFAIVLDGRVSRARKIQQPFRFAAQTGAGAAANLALRALRREPAYPGLRELVAAFHRAADSGGPSPISPETTLAVATARDRLIALAGLS